MELIAAIFFRCWGVVTMMNASGILLAQTINASMNRGSYVTFFSYGITQFLGPTAVAALLFFMAAPLARNVRRGLARVMDSKFTN